MRSLIILVAIAALDRCRDVLAILSETCLEYMGLYEMHFGEMCLCFMAILPMCSATLLE